MVIKMNYSNSFHCVKLAKIHLNFNSKYVVFEKKQLLSPFLALKMITGQKPKVVRAKKSVASFKLKAQNLIGCQVTLRSHKMFSFIQYLSQIIFPRWKEFQYLKPTFFQQSTYINVGLHNFLLFPQIERNVELFEHLSGCALNLQTSSKCHRETLLLLTGFKFPCFSSL
jgi:large subunit ribosomal protein L5